ncbi:MAG: hypothetical protein ABR529_04985 [Actinomycetota bacterium]
MSRVSNSNELAGRAALRRLALRPLVRLRLASKPLLNTVELLPASFRVVSSSLVLSDNREVDGGTGANRISTPRAAISGGRGASTQG